MNGLQTEMERRFCLVCQHTAEYVICHRIGSASEVREVCVHYPTQKTESPRMTKLRKPLDS